MLVSRNSMAHTLFVFQYTSLTYLCQMQKQVEAWPVNGGTGHTYAMDNRPVLDTVEAGSLTLAMEADTGERPGGFRVMARPLRIEIPGTCYHVMNRGNQRQTVFRGTCI
jgi:hypothetical protein